MLLRLLIMASLLMITLPGVARASWSESSMEIDPPLLFEITEYPDGGFFTVIHSVAISSFDDSIYVLHETPAVLSQYSLHDGQPLDQFSINDRVESPAEVIPFDGRIFIIADRKFRELTSSGDLIVPVFAKEKFNASEIDLAASYFDDTLWLADTKSNQIVTLTTENGKAVQIYPAKARKKGKRKAQPFVNIQDMAVGFPNVLFVLDNYAGVIRKFNAAGKMLDVISLTSSFDSDAAPDTTSITTDNFHNIWTLNRSDNSLDVYDSFGSLTFRVLDTNEDGFRFISPVAIFSDNREILGVIDEGSTSVKIFDISSGL